MEIILIVWAERIHTRENKMMLMSLMSRLLEACTLLYLLEQLHMYNHHVYTEHYLQGGCADRRVTIPIPTAFFQPLLPPFNCRVQWDRSAPYYFRWIVALGRTSAHRSSFDLASERSRVG